MVEGIKKLGMDPRQIKYVLISHGHGDHDEGAKILQDRGVEKADSGLLIGLSLLAQGVGAQLAPLMTGKSGDLRASSTLMQVLGLIGGQRSAHDAGGVADDERHLLRRAERGGDEQVALVLAIVIVGDDHDLALGEGGDHSLDALMGFDVHEYAFLIRLVPPI